MQYWQFRAYDANYSIKNGIATGDDYRSVILAARQRGLQIFWLAIVTVDEYAASRQALRQLRHYQSIRTDLTRPATLSRKRRYVVAAIILIGATLLVAGWLLTLRL